MSRTMSTNTARTTTEPVLKDFDVTLYKVEELLADETRGAKRKYGTTNYVEPKIKKSRKLKEQIKGLEHKIVLINQCLNVLDQRNQFHMEDVYDNIDLINARLDVVRLTNKKSL